MDTVEKSFTQIPKLEDGVYFKYFQFKLLHSGTVTNEKLHKMKLTDTNICNFVKLNQNQSNTLF